jgi:hypothetical protein
MGGVAESHPSWRIYDATMLGRAATIAAASFVLLVSCSDSSSNSDETTTTVASSSTTAAETTTTVAAPVETAPSTTVGEAEQLAAAEQAYLDAFDAYIAAARDPSNPDLREEIERLYTGPNLEFTIDQLDGFVQQNWIARPGEEPSRTEILAGPQFLSDRSDFIELVACEINTEVFVEIGAAPDGSDALVTDEVTVRRGLVRLRSIDGAWKADSGETLAELATPAECEP